MKIKLERNGEHIKYKDAGGMKLPGVTTVLSEIAKPFLITWANQQGLKGIDIKKDRTALDIGTIAHFLIDVHLNGHEPDLDNYAPADVHKAELAYKAYLDLETKHGLKLIKNELPLVDPVMGFGGTCDLYCELGGLKTLVDFKTSGKIYGEYHLQIHAYRHLLEVNGFKVDQMYIFRIDKEDGSFEDKLIPYNEKEMMLFLKYLDIYKTRKELKI